MEEAEKYAKKIAVIDHGKIVAIGTSPELRRKTHTKTLEDAFLKLTGKDIRDEDASSIDFMRQRRRVMHR